MLVVIGGAVSLSCTMSDILVNKLGQLTRMRVSRAVCAFAQFNEHHHGAVDVQRVANVIQKVRKACVGDFQEPFFTYKYVCYTIYVQLDA